MVNVLFHIDLDKPFDQQAIVGHNRWHPDIPSVLSVKPGDVFRIECKDWTDGQIKNATFSLSISSTLIRSRSPRGVTPVSSSGQMAGAF